MAYGSNDSLVLGAVPTPLGTFGAAFSSSGLGRLTFPGEPFAACEIWAARWLPGARRPGDPGLLNRLGRELTAYFAGELREFTVGVDLRGTLFQVEVWRALQRVGYGEVRSYAALAAEIGRPRAVRAVGAANGANPVPILVPCHRLVGSDGGLTGYGGGLELKQRLLELERAPARAAARSATPSRRHGRSSPASRRRTPPAWSRRLESGSGCTPARR